MKLSGTPWNRLAGGSALSAKRKVTASFCAIFSRKPDRGSLEGHR
jgi:hypothetical protein